MFIKKKQGFLTNTLPRGKFLNSKAAGLRDIF
jgi:hypothetical protein